MSRTLFLYIFKDLLRIFLMASGAIAGILSFGGLLRPLTEQGLDATQMGQMLTYLSPAMTTYSLPIAALFATTVVYGRLSADNEITACRASGISYWSIATPALLLGLVVSIMSLLFLCFIVPVFLLKVEKVIFANLGDLVASQIQRDHSLEFRERGVTVFAQRAYTLPRDPNKPNEQSVVLEGPTIVKYDRPNPLDPGFRVPKDFMMARKATVTIRRLESGAAEVLINPEGITKFPREFISSMQIGVEMTYLPPMQLASLVRFRPKFMPLPELKRTLADPASSDSIQELLKGFAAREQEVLFARQVAEQINGSGRTYVFDSGATRFTLQRGDAVARVEGGIYEAASVVIRSNTDKPAVNFVEVRDGKVMFRADAVELKLSLHVNAETHAIHVSPEVSRAEIWAGGETNTKAAYALRTFIVPVPSELRALEQRQPSDYMESLFVNDGDKVRLNQRTTKLINSIQGELHARSSFSISCLILVMIGCALGMMFKSGNFLSAFAVSVIPALICITLIVTGQHTAESVGYSLNADNSNLRMGLMLIWSGNVAVAAIAAVLLERLRRQ